MLPSVADKVHLPMPAEHYRLPNGLEVVLHRDASFDAAIVDVRYHVGSKDDPEGASGFAHLHEHLTFRGRRPGSSKTLSDLLDSYGFLGSNAFTTTDETEYFELLPPAELPIALWIEATRMSTSLLAEVKDEEFAHERDVVKNEYRQNYETARFGFVQTFARAALFPPGHPYHRPTIGDPRDLDRATLDDARAFAATFYTPRNATLVVAGNIDVEVTRALIARHFEALDPGPETPLPRMYAFPDLSEDKIVHVEADVERPRLVVAWPLPPRYGKASYEAELVAADVTAVVHEDFERLLEIADSVDGSFRWGRLGSMYSLTIDLRRGKKPEDALQMIDAIVPLATSPLVRHAVAPFMPEWWLRRQVADIANLGDRATKLQDFVECFGWPDAANYNLARYRAASSAATEGAGPAFLNGHKVAVMVKPVLGAPRAGRVVP